jgi:hypothetical protein
MLLLDMDKKVDLREFISTLKNGTHENAVVFKEEGVPIAVLMAYEDYLELIRNVGNLTINQEDSKSPIINRRT